MNSETPQTDANEGSPNINGKWLSARECPQSTGYVRADKARELERENNRLRAIGNRMAEMLALAPEAPVTEWPDDDKVMAAVNEWRTLAKRRTCAASGEKGLTL